MAGKDGPQNLHPRTSPRYEGSTVTETYSLWKEAENFSHTEDSPQMDCLKQIYKNLTQRTLLYIFTSVYAFNLIFINY